MADTVYLDPSGAWCCGRCGRADFPSRAAVSGHRAHCRVEDTPRPIRELRVRPRAFDGFEDAEVRALRARVDALERVVLNENEHLRRQVAGVGAAGAPQDFLRWARPYLIGAGVVAAIGVAIWIVARDGASPGMRGLGEVAGAVSRVASAAKSVRHMMG